MKNKKVIVIISIFILVLIWYLFIKSGDYLVTFQTKSDSTIIVEAINNWGDDLEKIKDLEVITSKDSLFSRIEQTIKTKDSSYTIIWNIKQLNDSVSAIKVNVSEKNHSLKNRLRLLFPNAPIKKFAINSVLDFNKGFQKQLKTFHIKANGTDNIPELYCACISESSEQKNKASKMLLMNLNLTTFIRENDLEISGRPLLQITSWDKQNEKIDFDFCFPILKMEIMPLLKNGVFYKKIDSIPAIKGTYNGNYRYSDRTWNYLSNYAKSINFKVQQLPTEFFFNDPQQGGNELNWKAEIFMPIIK